VHDPNSNIPPNPYTRRWSAERPPEPQEPEPAPDAIEGEYEAPREQAPNKALKAAGPAAVGIGVLLLKFKGLLLLLLNFKWLFFVPKLFLTFGTFFASLWFYALFFGWKFALVFVLMIAAHELGHYFAYRNYGLRASLPTFIPGFGALTVGGIPKTAEQSAYISLAGPLTGLGAAAVCYGFGYATHEPFWYAAAYVGAFLNLFNMLPIPPFDGGGIAAAISPYIWIGGFVLFAIAAPLLHLPLIFVLVLGVLGLPRVIAVLRGRPDPAYATAGLSAAQRIAITLWYVGTAFGLVYLMNASRISVPHG